MGWARIDDGFDDHPKILALLEHDEGGAAVGLWTLCLTWAHRKRSRKTVRGLVPPGIASRYGGPSAAHLAKLLVSAGLWAVHDDGWLICDDEELFGWGIPRYQMPWIPRGVRWRVYERDGYRCQECGTTEDLTLDHKHPRSLGGTHTEDNLQTLCRGCNSRKGAQV